MKTKIKWLLLAGFLVLGVVVLKGYRLKPEPVAKDKRQQIIAEIAAADAGISTLNPGSLSPDYSGKTLAYLHLTDTELKGYADPGFTATLVDLKTLEKLQIPKTIMVRYASGWSADDRYWAFSQNNAPAKGPGQRKGKEEVVEEWMTVYDRKDGSTRRLTQEKNVKEQALYWLGKDSFLFAIHRMKTKDHPRFFLGNLNTPNFEKVSDFTEQLALLNGEKAAFTRNGALFTMGLKPLNILGNSGSNAVEMICDFKTNGLTAIQWLNYSPARSNYLFCSRPKESDWRYLYQYDPTSLKLTQLSHEATYNGQWLLGGAGYAYVVNTNNSFQLAIRTFAGDGNTNLFVEGNLVVYKASPGGERIYAVGSLGCEPHGIWEYTVASRQLRKVVEGVAQPFAASQVVGGEEFTLKSFDGVETPCFLFAPVALARMATNHAKTLMNRLQPRVEYPLVIHVPATSYQFQRRFDHQAQVFANLGFYFAAINYRGCDGYGAEYSKLKNVQDAARDVLNLYETLAANPNIDVKNIYITTTSGGMAIVDELLATHPQLWAGVAVDKPGGVAVNPRFEANKLPPQLMIFGGQDPAFNYDSLTAYADWAKSNHVDFRSVIHTNSGHLTRSLVDRKDVLQQMADFFCDILR